MEIGYGIIVSIPVFLDTVATQRYGTADVRRLARDAYNDLDDEEKRRVVWDWRQGGGTDIGELIRDEPDQIFRSTEFPTIGSLQTTVLSRTSSHVFVGVSQSMDAVPANLHKMIDFEDIQMTNDDLIAGGFGDVKRPQIYICKSIEDSSGGGEEEDQDEPQ